MNFIRCLFDFLKSLNKVYVEMVHQIFLDSLKIIFDEVCDPHQVYISTAESSHLCCLKSIES
jgi:hypothetical protein